MERLTYDFALGGNHCWQVKGADNLECREVCERQGDDGCKTCPIAKAFDRLAAIEDILGDEYDLERLSELVKADKEGRCGIPPVKMHQKIFRVFDEEIYEETVCGAIWEPLMPRPRWKVFVMGSGCVYYWDDVLGKTVFLTRAEAETALRREQK